MKKSGARIIIFLILALGVLSALIFRSHSPEAPTRAANSDHPTSPQGLPVPTPLPSILTRSDITDNDRRLLTDLTQIMKSRNDNDPRLDTEFRHLTPGTKQLLLEKYDSLPMEARNERGTIVFLIGRELNRAEDFKFLAQVTAEPPCLSLGNCGKDGPHAPEDSHEDSTISVSLAYPQHVSVKSIENYLAQAEKGGGDPARMEDALNALDRMTESPVTSIAQMATRLRNHFSNLRHPS